MTHQPADDQGRHSPRNHAPGALRRHASRANLAGKRVQNRQLAVSPFDPLQRLVCIVRSGEPTRLPAGGEETGAPKENRFVREVGRNEGRDLGDHEVVKEGSQRSAQRHPWLVVTQIRRPPPGFRRDARGQSFFLVSQSLKLDFVSPAASDQMQRSDRKWIGKACRQRRRGCRKGPFRIAFR